jgi:N-formylglutamate deformylase
LNSNLTFFFDVFLVKSHHPGCIIPEKMYFTPCMEDLFTLRMDGNMPVVATAIHDGHHLSMGVSRYSVLDDSVRLREEDPYTGLWTDISDNRILVHLSRFEFDLNRPPGKAIYLVPSDAWGLELWKSRPPAELLEGSMERYREFYARVREGLSALVKRFGRVAVYDLHSYNHRRGGPLASPDDPALNPEINLGTGTMDRAFWEPVVERFLRDLKNYDFPGKQLDIRENIKFKGGYFPRWIHENFPGSVCCLSIEVKKFFMDEWTGRPDHSIIRAFGDALMHTVPGVIEELSRHGTAK